MSEYATNGAMLECTCGMIPMPLQTTGNTSVFVQGQNVATISDKAPIGNIKPFGQCKMKPTIFGFGPCVPAPTAWTGFVASVQIPGGNPLLKTSTIMCGGGGIIKFKDSGQKKSAKVVVNPSSPQITTLQAAAISGTPFCEECEKSKVEKTQQISEPEITEILWLDEKGEPRQLHEVRPNEQMTLCVQTRNIVEGKTISLTVTDGLKKKYKGGSEKMTFTAKVESDGIACVDNVKLEYE